MTDLPKTDLRKVASALAAAGGLPPRASLAVEMRRIRRSEIVASTQLAGSSLETRHVDALLDLGRAVGDRLFSHYILVRDYATAADWVAAARGYPSGDPRPILTLDELRGLHTRATAGAQIPGGAWRQGNPALAAGFVAPAAWMVARDVTVLLDRFGRRPSIDAIPLWLARFLGRFARLLPFEGANGRVARLAANLMLRRLDIAPLVFEQRDRRRYPAALAAARATDPIPLASLIATAMIRTANRLITAAESEADAVAPLRQMAGADYTALAKAAQRGRLRTIVRGGRYFTTAAWIDEYRSATGRRA